VSIDLDGIREWARQMATAKANWCHVGGLFVWAMGYDGAGRDETLTEMEACERLREGAGFVEAMLAELDRRPDPSRMAVAERREAFDRLRERFCLLCGREKPASGWCPCHKEWRGA
jgi:hypothetical protein